MQVKKIATIVGLMSVALLGASQVSAQVFSDKPIQYIIPFPPGGESDVVARLQSDISAKQHKQPMVVINRAGAGGALVWSQLNNYPNDGTNVIGVNIPHIMLQPLQEGTQYKTTDINSVYYYHFTPDALMVSADSPYKTYQEFIAAAKKNPGKLTYISAGSGTSPHMAGELLKTMAGIDIQHVPYKNINQGFTDLFAGTVSMTFYHVPVIYPHVKDGRLRALGVATSERSPIAPEVPPIADTVKGYDIRPWWGLAGPAGIPKDIVEKLHKATTQVLADPEVQERFKNMGLIITPMSTQQFNDFTVTELAKWSKIVKDSGASAN